MMPHQGAQGWKFRLMRWFDSLFFRIPMLTEFVNQGISKNLGLLTCWHFLARTNITGDYVEFGVFRGETFRNMLRASQMAFRATTEGKYIGRFFAFDSFSGLPEVESMKNEDNIFAPGDFSSSQQNFMQNIKSAVKKSEVVVIPGWFDKTCTLEMAKANNLQKIAFANIDCDLYESTQSVLQFIRPYLQTGSVIYFDDWYSCKGSMNEGEPKACQEWLEQNPQIKLIEFRNVGVLGKAFIVNVNS